MTLPRMPDCGAAGALDRDPAAVQAAMERQVAVVIAQDDELAAEPAVDQQSADPRRRARVASSPRRNRPVRR